MCKTNHGSVGGVYLEETTSKYYDRYRVSDSKLRNHYNSQVNTISTITKSAFMKGHANVTSPILVWQSDYNDNKFAIVAPIELWHGIYHHTVPTESEHHNRLIDAQKIRWKNVYKVEGGEKEIQEVIASLGPITQPLDIMKIVRDRGLKKIDLYGTDGEDNGTKQVPVPKPSPGADASADDTVQNTVQTQKVQAQPRQNPTLESLVMLEELEHVFPPLDDASYQLLKDDLIMFGECMHPIVIWGSRNTVIDGHNRVRACLEIKKEKGIDIKYRIRPIEFDDIPSATIWIIRNQIHRRQLSEYDRCQMILRCRDEITKINNEKKKMNLKQYHNQPVPPKSAMDVPAEKHVSCNSGNKEEQVDDKENILAGLPEPSREKLRKVRKIQECGTESIIKDTRSGRMSINAAFNKVQEGLKASDESKQEDEAKEKSKSNVLESLKLKIGKELIPLYTGVNPGGSILVLTTSKSTTDLEKMLKEHGFDVEDTRPHEKARIMVMSERNYYDDRRSSSVCGTR